MSNPVFISVCIPAYKNVSYLRRLLDSIAMQTYHDYEVIVTDDSPDESVQAFVSTYNELPGIRYIRNTKALGTPENWNEGIRQARGEWIKIMHDDDWFARPDSLETFAGAAARHTGLFIFSAYTNIFLETGARQQVFPSASRLRAMKKEPYTLFAKNVIGPPSVTMHRNDGSIFYDRNTKWVVDIDFYIRRLRHEEFYYIDQALVNVGMSSQQVTMDCVGNRNIQVPENFYLLNKMPPGVLNNLIVYDGWWRLIRNLEITEERHIRDAGYVGEIPPAIKSMIRWQKRVPRNALTNGFFSKTAMFSHYIMH